MRFRVGCCLVLAMVLLFGAAPPVHVAAEQSMLPTGFTRVLHASGLEAPTAFAFEGDRIFVAQRDGTVRVVQADGTLRAEPYVTLSISSDFERGMLGIAVDPKFSKNKFVYVYYATGPGSKDYSGTPVNRVSRFKTKHGVGINETILVDNLPSDTGYHNGGDMHFGFDGKLYVAVGDGGQYWGDAVLLGNPRGKILRINRDGSTPSTNPFYDRPNADKRIFAYGFRNPFRFAPRKSNSSYIVGDVGYMTWEELDSLTAGADYGWYRYEGPCPFETLKCDTRATDFGTTTPPIHYYKHTGHKEHGGAIIAGAFPSGSNYPAPYSGALFYGDWLSGWVHVLELDSANHEIARHDFDELDAPIAFATGPDGNIYVLDHSSGSVYKYVYTP